MVRNKSNLEIHQEGQVFKCAASFTNALDKERGRKREGKDKSEVVGLSCQHRDSIYTRKKMVEKQVGRKWQEIKSLFLSI